MDAMSYAAAVLVGLPSFTDLQEIKTIIGFSAA